MKRSLKIVFAVLIYIFLTVCAVLTVTPSGGFVMERLARDESGNIYVAGNAKRDIVVWQLDADGTAYGYYRCRREAGQTDILCGYYDGSLYISQTWKEDGIRKFSIWKTGRPGRSFLCILQGTIENDIQFTDMRINADGIYLAGMDLQTQEIVCCRYRDSDEDIQIVRYGTDYIPLMVSFGRGGLYALSGSGVMYFIGEDGREQVQGDHGETAVLATDKGGMYWQNAGSRDINYLFYSGNEGYVIRDIGYLKDIEYADSTQNSAVLLHDPDQLIVAGLDAQYAENGQNGYLIETISLSPGRMVRNAALPIVMVTLVYIAVCAAITLIIRFIRYKSRLLYKTLTAISGLSGLALAVIVAVVHFQGSGTYSGMVLVVTAFAEWLVVMIITMLFLGHIWRNMDIIITWMDRVSRGEYHIEGRKAPDNEFGMMWTALERMCRKLQVQKYRHTEVTDYLYQYAPKNFEQLFDKESLQDVAVGMTRQLPATIGMISIIDKDTLLTGKLQKQYMQYVNKLMELLFSQRESDRAIFLQDGNNLENVKVVFKDDGESVAVALKYSIECMEALLGQTETQYDTTPFMLLHTAEVSCGLAGGSKQVYPYVTSLEIETLGSYIERFKNSGARIVVTESTWQQAEGQVQGRYIGYISSADGRCTFRLYEIIDACPQPQKLGRMKNKERFERALELFYNDDLYLARSAFADILKECPDDGISGWYVFACDEMFNEGDASEKRHELFHG